MAVDTDLLLVQWPVTEFKIWGAKHPHIPVSYHKDPCSPNSEPMGWTTVPEQEFTPNLNVQGP